MGLLKHVLLPAFGIMHVAAAAACSDLTSWAAMVGLPKESVTPPPDDENKNNKSLLRQRHMLGALRGFNVAMGLLCVLGVATESAHFRAQIVLAQAVLYSVVAVDAFRLGTLNFWIPASQALVAVAGFVVNAMEPGIFTKDKSIKTATTARA